MSANGEEALPPKARYLSVKEAYAIFGSSISLKTFYRYLKLGLIPSHKPAGVYLIEYSALISAIEGKATAPPPERKRRQRRTAERGYFCPLELL
jgi:hypothetical protein